MKNTSLLFLLLLSVSTAVLARDPGYYIGAAYSDLDFDTSGFDDDDSGYNLDFGFSVSRHFALELSYHDLGGQTFPNRLYSYDADGIAFSLVGQFHLEEVSIYGKLGVMSWDTDGRANVGNVPAFPDESDTTLLLGIGGAYYFSEEFSVNLEYEVVDDFDVAGSQLTDFDVYDSLGILSLGLRFHF